MGHWYNPLTNDRADFPIAGWLPSVNTILAATRAHDHQQALAKAALKKPFEFAQKTQRACDRGDGVHGWISAYLQQQPLPELRPGHERWRDRVKPYLDGLLAIADIVAVEQPVFHSEFAGQPDLVIRLRLGYRLTILDFKTKDKPIFPQALHEGAVQLAGYAEAYQYQHTEAIQDLSLIAIHPTHVQAHRFQPDSYLQEWVNRRTAYAQVSHGA